MKAFDFNNTYLITTIIFLIQSTATTPPTEQRQSTTRTYLAVLASVVGTGVVPTEAERGNRGKY